MALLFLRELFSPTSPIVILSDGAGRITTVCNLGYRRYKDSVACIQKNRKRRYLHTGFQSSCRNNEITFPTSEEIAVVYGPNGTGKTSLIKVLGDAKGTKVEFSLDGTEYQVGADVFHIINDQNNRNIISGETRDFFLEIIFRYEFELQDQVAEDRSAVISAILSLIKNTFGISAGNSLYSNYCLKLKWLLS